MPSEETTSEFARLTDRLREAGWAAHVTVERLIVSWQSLATDVGDYPLTIDDYTNDLTARDALELVLTWATPSTREALTASLVQADDQFRARTVDDAGAAVGRFYRPGSSRGWWWQRRPTSGALARYLDNDTGAEQ